MPAAAGMPLNAISSNRASASVSRRCVRVRIRRPIVGSLSIEPLEDRRGSSP